MTYAQSITQSGQQTRAIIIIAGADECWATYTGGTYSSLTVRGELLDVSISPGSLDRMRHIVSPTTISASIQDSTYARTFFSRRVVGTPLLASITTSSATITISETGYTADTYLYVGHECIKIVSNDTGGVYTVSRGQLSTTAEYHPAGADVGTTPRALIGTKITLVLGSRSATGVWTYSTAQAARIESSPVCNAGAWQIQASSGIRSRETMIGRVDALTVQAMQRTSSTNVEVICSGFTPCRNGSTPVRVILKDGSRAGLYYAYIDDEITYSEGGYGSWTISVVYTPLSSDLLAGDDVLAAHEEFDNATHNSIFVDVSQITVAICWSLTSDVITTALRYMMSRHGLASTHATYDYLPGWAPSVTRAEQRHGAGLTTDEVDVTSWTSITPDMQIGSHEYVPPLGGEVPLSEYLSREIAPLVGGYIYHDADDKIAIKKYLPSTAIDSAEYTIDSTTMIGLPQIYDDETQIMTRIEIGSGYSAGSGDYRTIHKARYAQQEHTHGAHTQPYSVMSKYALINETQALHAFDAIASIHALGVIVVRATLPWTAHALRAGDYVSVSSSLLPSYDGSASLSSLAQLVSVGIDIKSGLVSVTAHIVPTAKIIAPAAVLGAGSGDTWPATGLYGTAVATDFAAGWYVKIISGTTGVERGSTYLISVGASVELETAPAGTASGDYMIVDDTANKSTTNNSTGYDQTDIARLGSAGIASTGDVWR